MTIFWSKTAEECGSPECRGIIPLISDYLLYWGDSFPIIDNTQWIFIRFSYKCDSLTLIESLKFNWEFGKGFFFGCVNFIQLTKFLFEPKTTIIFHWFCIEFIFSNQIEHSKSTYFFTWIAINFTNRAFWQLKTNATILYPPLITLATIIFTLKLHFDTLLLGIVVLLWN